MPMPGNAQDRHHLQARAGEVVVVVAVVACVCVCVGSGVVVCMWGVVGVWGVWRVGGRGGGGGDHPHVWQMRQ